MNHGRWAKVIRYGLKYMGLGLWSRSQTMDKATAASWPDYAMAKGLDSNISLATQGQWQVKSKGYAKA